MLLTREDLVDCHRALMAWTDRLWEEAPGEIQCDDVDGQVSPLGRKGTSLHKITESESDSPNEEQQERQDTQEQERQQQQQQQQQRMSERQEQECERQREESIPESVPILGLAKTKEIEFVAANSVVGSQAEKAETIETVTLIGAEDDDPILAARSMAEANLLTFPTPSVTLDTTKHNVHTLSPSSSSVLTPAVTTVPSPVRTRSPLSSSLSTKREGDPIDTTDGLDMDLLDDGIVAETRTFDDSNDDVKAVIPYDEKLGEWFERLYLMKQHRSWVDNKVVKLSEMQGELYQNLHVVHGTVSDNLRGIGGTLTELQTHVQSQMQPHLSQIKSDFEQLQDELKEKIGFDTRDDNDELGDDSDDDGDSYYYDHEKNDNSYPPKKEAYHGVTRSEHAGSTLSSPRTTKPLGQLPLQTKLTEEIVSTETKVVDPIGKKRKAWSTYNTPVDRLGTKGAVEETLGKYVMEPWFAMV